MSNTIGINENLMDNMILDLKDRIDLISKFGMMYDIFNEKLDYYIKDNSGDDSELSESREDFIDYDFKLSDEIQTKKKTLDQI